MTGRRLTPMQVFSASAASVKRAMRNSAARHDLCQDAIAEHTGVGQQMVSRWFSSRRDDTPPLSRLALAPREFVVDVLRDVLSEHHAVVVDLLHFGTPGDDPDATVMRELDAAQMGSARVLHEMLTATADRVIDRAEATTVRQAIRAVIEPLMALDRRMERIEANGPEGIGASRGTH